MRVISNLLVCAFQCNVILQFTVPHLRKVLFYITDYGSFDSRFAIKPFSNGSTSSHLSMISNISKLVGVLGIIVGFDQVVMHNPSAIFAPATVAGSLAG